VILATGRGANPPSMMYSLRVVRQAAD
jgi:hypothetical protein